MAALTASNPARACSASCAAAGRQPRRLLPVTASSSNTQHAAVTNGTEPAAALQRRQLLSAVLLAPAAAALLGATAAAPAWAEESKAAPSTSSAFTYEDEEDKFTISVPAGWVQGSGTLGEGGTLTTNQSRFSNAAGLRRVIAFLPEDNPAVSVAITVQFLTPDYTKMGSFGTAAEFAASVVTRMDTSYIQDLPEWRRAKEGPVQVARLVDARETNGQYVFSYTLAKDGEPERTVYQAVAIGDTGRHHRLFTVNATCTGADKSKYAPVLEGIVKSFTPPPATLA